MGCRSNGLSELWAVGIMLRIQMYSIKKSCDTSSIHCSKKEVAVHLDTKVNSSRYFISIKQCMALSVTRSWVRCLFLQTNSINPTLIVFSVHHANTTGTRIPDPPFSSFGPSRDYGMDLCLEVYL